MRHDSRGLHFSLTATMMALVAACTIGNPDRTVDEHQQASPSSEFHLVEVGGLDYGDEGWADSRTAELYLDGDADAEVVFVASRGGVSPNDPDARLWTVVVTEPDRERTVVYARVLRLGSVEVVAAQNEQGEAGLLILERMPNALRAYRIQYAGPGEIRTENVGHWPLNPNVDWYGKAPLPLQATTVAR